jgi:hypothetical protein
VKEDKCLFILDTEKKISDYYNIPEGLVESVPKPIKVATVENVGVFILIFFQREREYRFLYRKIMHSFLLIL